MADKLGVELRLEVTHMAAGRRKERKRTRRWRESEGGETVSFSVMWRPHKLVSLLSVGAFFGGESVWLISNALERREKKKKIFFSSTMTQYFGICMVMRRVGESFSRSSGFFPGKYV